ncbi:MAG: DUF2339 domain-containing protein [Bacteroidota bacterium]
MTDNPDSLSRILDRLETLAGRQRTIQQEIDNLRRDIQNLVPTPGQGVQAPEMPPADAAAIVSPELMENRPALPEDRPAPVKSTPDGTSETTPRHSFRLNMEKFIGENLINKIGIAITVLGVGVGAKFAIDHELISPLTRIILGYLAGLTLLGVAFRLRKQYAGFSAVLLSGAMAILYFITFAAYDFYSLIPVTPAFAIMTIITLFTVAAAILYDKQVIAHVGLVGAYAVPFLLDDGSGKVAVLFSYMTLINTGILAIAFRKYWKPLYYSSFILTWFIFFTWFSAKYQPAGHLGLALGFVTGFFATFYLISIAYKVLKNEAYGIENVLLLMANSAIFYGLGYAALGADKTGESFLGLFTLANAAVHGTVAILLWRRKPADKNLFYYVTGLALVFTTIAIPVQWDGRWVTLLWTGEVALLFWIGRVKGGWVFELLSYPLMFAVFFSLVHDWSTVYGTYDPKIAGSRIFPVFNINFLTSLFFCASFGIINYLHQNRSCKPPLAEWRIAVKIMGFCIPGILLTVLYCSLLKEILTFWNQQFLDSGVTVNTDLTLPKHVWNDAIYRFSTLSVINYSMLFLSLLSLANIRRIRNSLLGNINLGLNAIVLGLFLTIGLYTIGGLRENYISQDLSQYYYRGVLFIGARYISFVFAGIMICSIFQYVRWELLKTDFRVEFDLFLHVTLLTVAGNELINWMDLYEPGQSYKLGLTILFGLYALLLVAMGIRKRKAHLRIGAIVLFAATLVKLFLYDINYLNTISKTIVFVSLGILLLISSFLYTKYGKRIFEDHEEKPGG